MVMVVMDDGGGGGDDDDDDGEVQKRVYYIGHGPSSWVFFKYNMMETDSFLEIYLIKPKIMVGVKNNGHIHATGCFKQVVFLSTHYTMLEWQKMMALSLQ